MSDSTFLTWPFFEATHRRLAAALDEFSAAELSAVPHHGDVEEICRGLVRKLGQTGFLRYTVPAAYGGHHDRLDVRSLCLCREKLAYANGLADFSFVMQGLGTGAISLFGSTELKKKYLPPVGRGERIAALAMSEENAGSDVAAIATTARREGDFYVLDGEKTWISNGAIADQFVAIVRTGEGPGAKGLSAIVVDADSPGFSVKQRIEVIAPHPLATLRFDSCRVPASNLLGEPGQGFKVAMANLDIFRSTVGAAALGFARRALDEALRRTTEREIFGRKLSEFQLTQAKIGNMATEVDAAALLVYRAAWTKDSGASRVTREASMAKMYATEMAQRVVDQAVQLFGGLGVTSGQVVEQLYREVRALRIYEGTTEVNQLVIAGQTMQAFTGQ